MTDLTPREKEVMELVCSGFESRQIATDLRLSIRTVEAHRASAMQKLGARTAAHAVAILTAEAVSRRDWFIGQALAGLLAQNRYTTTGIPAEAVRLGLETLALTDAKK